MDIRLNAPLIVPSPDAIGEFNLITSTINPEYGRNSGGILNAIIKSGTNQFHGDAFEFYRDTFLNSRDFFQTTAPVFHQNQYGGTVGAPFGKITPSSSSPIRARAIARPTRMAPGETTVFTQAQRNGYFPDIASSTTASPFRHGRREWRHLRGGNPVQRAISQWPNPGRGFQPDIAKPSQERPASESGGEPL